MAANNEKIKAGDIFDANVAVAYKDFIELNKQASIVIEQLKKDIRELNLALRKNKSATGPMKAVVQSTQQLGVAVTNTKNKTISLNEELTKTSTKLAQTRSQMKRTSASSKNLGSAISSVGKGIRSLLGALGIATLIIELVNFAKATYATAKALESMDLALSKVTDSAYEFAKAQETLVKMSDRLGINLLKTAKRYNTFLAAARQAGFTQAENNEIFETFATVGANLALSTDEMGGIFLALEQMMSKGKISTEELRRQLGEKLPGAFGLMAEAVGVSTGKLDDMLRKGLVPTAEYLPEFTRVVREYFNVNLEDRVDTLAASQERLTNEFTLFVRAVAGPGSKVGEFFKDLLDDTTQFLNKITEVVEVMAYIHEQEMLKDSGDPNFWDGMAVGAQRFLDTVKPVMDFIRDSALVWMPFGQYFLSDSTSYAEGKEQMEIAKGYKARGTAMNELARILKGYELEVLGIEGGTGQSAASQNIMMNAMGYSQEELDETIEFIKKAVQDVRNAEKKAQEERDKEEEEREKKRKKDRDKRRQDFIDEHKGHSHVEMTATAGPDGRSTLVSANEDLVNMLNKELDKLILQAAEFRREMTLYGSSEDVEKELAEVEGHINNFRTRIGALSGQTGGGLIEPITEFRSPSDQTPQWAQDRNAKKANRQLDNKGTIFGGLEDKEAWVARLEVAQDIADQIWEMEENLHQRRLDRLEEEKQASAYKYEELYHLAQNDAEQTERLKIREAEDAKKFDEEEKKLEKEQAKRKKRQALIDIALNAAVAMIKLWVKPGFPEAVPLAVVVGAVALASAAAALSAPEYAEGTDFHPGGPAIVGDGGKREIVVNPDGSMTVTDDKPQLVNMDRGSSVIADAQEFINKQVIKSIIDTNDRMDDMIVEKITEAVQKGFKGVNINNNVTLRGSADFHSYRHRLLN